jgi:hypothetical protein
VYRPSPFGERSPLELDDAALPQHRPRLRRELATAFPVDVLHDLFAPLVLEIDVDVGRLLALDADEALEE